MHRTYIQNLGFFERSFTIHTILKIWNLLHNGKRDNDSYGIIWKIITFCCELYKSVGYNKT